MILYVDFILWDSSKSLPNVLKELKEEGFLDIKIRKQGEWEHLPKEITAVFTEITYSTRRKGIALPFLPPRYEKVKVLTKYHEIRDGDIIGVKILRTEMGELKHYQLTLSS